LAIQRNRGGKNGKWAVDSGPGKGVSQTTRKSERRGEKGREKIGKEKEKGGALGPKRFPGGVGVKSVGRRGKEVLGRLGEAPRNVGVA